MDKAFINKIKNKANFIILNLKNIVVQPRFNIIWIINKIKGGDFTDFLSFTNNTKKIANNKYNIGHTTPKTHPGGFNLDLFKDLYHVLFSIYLYYSTI